MGLQRCLFQRLKGKRWYKVPEAITWTGFSLILQGEQYQTQLCGKVVPMQREHRRPPSFAACHPCSEERPAAVWFGSDQHKWRNLIISFSRRNSDAYPALLCAAFANVLHPSALAGFDKNVVMKPHASFCFKWRPWSLHCSCNFWT